jgi:hypothetical protein
MAHLWTQNQQSDWAICPLRSDYHALSPNPRDPVRPLRVLRPVKNGVLVGRYASPAGGENWILKCSATAPVRVNGQPVYLGTRTLKDRDEIVLAGTSRFYFSTEELARVEPFPGAAQPVFCTRCKEQIAKDTLAVRCPACGQWCHQTDEKPCWPYGPSCPLCDQPTALDAGYRWTPEEL